MCVCAGREREREREREQSHKGREAGCKNESHNGDLRVMVPHVKKATMPRQPLSRTEQSIVKNTIINSADTKTSHPALLATIFFCPFDHSVISPSKNQKREKPLLTFEISTPVPRPVSTGGGGWVVRILGGRWRGVRW